MGGNEGTTGEWGGWVIPLCGGGGGGNYAEPAHVNL